MPKSKRRAGVVIVPVPLEPFEVGGEATIAAMDEYSRMEIGRKTYRFVRRCMRDPELRARIQARAAEIRAENEARYAANT